MLLDTSGLMCCLDASDHRHHDAVTLFDAATRKLLYNYVLLELISVAQARKLPRQLTLDFVRDTVNHPDIEVLWVEVELHNAGLSLLTRQLDKSFSLCDAVSFEVMRRRGVIEALTTDRHFDQAGFRRVLSP